MSYSFRAGARLRRSGEFSEVYRRGMRMNVFPLKITCLKRHGASESRLGLSVGRKIGPAVVRNRWKRTVREAFRLYRGALRVPCDIIVSISREAEVADAKQTQKAFIKFIEQFNELCCK